LTSLRDPIAIGVDVGSTTCKAVVIDREGAIVHHRVEQTHPRTEQQTSRILDELRLAAGKELPIGATGYGRKRVPGATKVLTEITCHARGAWSRLKRAVVLVDMGGQDTKIVRIGAGGDVADFAMNDKCAAGTGRFLEVILGRLQVPFAEVSAHVARAQRSVAVSSTCTVFAESEVISLVAQGEELEGILRGLHESLAKRVASLAGVLPADAEIVMSGGVALNAAMVDALATALKRRVSVLPEPQLVGALGAALAAS
jgi:predicted CoA-substrate-specific enzyme activase